jgi:hypothetical protein
MVKKTQIVVKIFEANRQEDFLVPSEMTVREVISLIVRIVFPAGHPGLDRASEFAMFDVDRSLLCIAENTVEQCGLKRGSRVLLV